MKRNNSTLFVVRHRSRGIPMKSCLMVSLLLCLTISLFSACQVDPTQQPSESQSASPQQPAEKQPERNPEPGNAHQIMALYRGQLYSHRGHSTDSLPEGLEYIGAVNKVDEYNITQDLDGNCDGYLYSDPDNDEILYFEYAHWDVEVNNGRPAPIVILNAAKD